MKERFLNFIKWFFIILGILFLIQLLILSGIFIGFSTIKEPDVKVENVNLKEIQPIVDYADKYRKENNKYPENVDVKIKKGEYKYSTSNNSNCYQITYTHKNTTKEYSCCMTSSENSNSKSESYSEVTK